MLKIHNHWLQVMALIACHSQNSNILLPICCFKHWDVCLSIVSLLLFNLGCTVSPQCCLQVAEAHNNKKLAAVNWGEMSHSEDAYRCGCGQWCLAICSAPLLTVWSLSHRAHCAGGEEAVLLQSNACCNGFKLKNPTPLWFLLLITRQEWK